MREESNSVVRRCVCVHAQMRKHIKIYNLVKVIWKDHGNFNNLYIPYHSSSMLNSFLIDLFNVNQSKFILFILVGRKKLNHIFMLWNDLKWCTFLRGRLTNISGIKIYKKNKTKIINSNQCIFLSIYLLLSYIIFLFLYMSLFFLFFFTISWCCYLVLLHIDLFHLSNVLFSEMCMPVCYTVWRHIVMQRVIVPRNK